MSSSDSLSFLPDDYMERKAQRRTNAICATLFAVMVCGIGAAFTFTEKSLRQVEKEHDQIEHEFTDAARQLEQVQKMQDKQRKMAHQAELTASLLEKVPRTYLLAEVTNALPQGVSLLDVVMASTRRIAPAASTAGKTAYELKKAALEAQKSPAVAPVAEAKVLDTTLKITGIALTDVQVAQLIGRLNRSTLLREVNLIVSDEFVQDGDKMRRFVIETQLNPDAEIKPGQPRAGQTAAMEIDRK